MTYDDLLLNRITPNEPDEDEEYEEEIESLIDEIEELDNLLSPEAQELIEDLRPYIVTDDVYEDIDESEGFGERLANLLTGVAGNIRFTYLNFAWFAGWIIWNSGVLPNVVPFDPFPFGLLTAIVSLEAIFLSLFVLISQNRQATKDRAVFDNSYQINLKSEIEIADLHRKLDVLTDTMMTQTRLVNALVEARRKELNATVRLIESNRGERPAAQGGS